MTHNLNLAKAQAQFLKEKLGLGTYEFLTDLSDIERLEAQESITSEQLREVIRKEQGHRYLAKRLRVLIMSKNVRG